MAVYRYVTNINANPGYVLTIGGVTFTHGTPIDYSSDQLNLNQFVPEQLDRYVDGVLSNTNLSVPYVEPSKAELQKYGPIQGYTSAQIIAATDASTLTPSTWYMASDTKTIYWCPDSSTAQPLSTAVHLGTITTAAMLTYSSPTTGMTCDLSDLGNVPSRWRYNGTYWAPLGGRQLVHMLLEDAYNATADGTERPIPGCQVKIPSGLLAYNGAGVEAFIGVEKMAADSESPILRLRMGANGDYTDAQVGGDWPFTTSSSTLGKQSSIYRKSATTVQLRGVSGILTSTSAIYGNMQVASRAAAITVPNMDSSANYLTLTGQRTTPFAEYLVANTFEIWMTGR